MSNVRVCISRFEAYGYSTPGGLVVRGSATESRVPGSNPASATGGEREGTARCGAVRCGRLVQGGRGAGAVQFYAAARGRDRC
eukprot:253181-Prymnesium_polylepis.1